MEDVPVDRYQILAWMKSRLLLLNLYKTVEIRSEAHSYTSFSLIGSALLL